MSTWNWEATQSRDWEATQSRKWVLWPDNRRIWYRARVASQYDGSFIVTIWPPHGTRAPPVRHEFVGTENEAKAYAVALVRMS